MNVINSGQFNFLFLIQIFVKFNEGGREAQITNTRIKTHITFGLFVGKRGHEDGISA